MSAVVEERVEATAALVSLNLVDEQNPWLGLDSFSEETRQFFHGREEEIAELARRVQRKTLAILFGQSGLGKTSILRAGIVPRLRREGYCPVYVRIDYARESPSPSQQIKQAIFRATEDVGRWTRPGSAVPGESLWEFLHHRDDFLVDDEGKTLTPLVIFDQFEEIFTLGQNDAFGRERASEFIEDLADLVENRAPQSLQLMLDSDDSIVERFDFERADYRILIALREDYLAHLEGLKGRMPSITQNRMRLARMTGDQALAAVLKPGGRLVTEEVAESIVRFIAGGAELRNAEVEPSLLSLVCRELNNTRIAQKRPEISSDLLAGSRETILKEFYERALADQPEGVRRFIEDEMLTESGFRESLAEERVLRAFDAANAAPGSLPLLVNRRLLRIEERLDMRRVELTHDVLCPVVAESRNQRQEREAREEAERQVAAQREREAATRKALVRARQIAAGCAVLAVVAIAGGAFGLYAMTRARDAEAQAIATRSEAEKLIVYLIDDFYLELAPVGRLDVVAGLSKRAIDYYDGLPAAQRSLETQRNRALAQVRYGHALALLSKFDESEKTLVEATGVLAGLRDGGDKSEPTAIGLGLGYAATARLRLLQTRYPEELAAAEKAGAVVDPLMREGKPSTALLRAHGDAMTRLGFAQTRSGKEAEGAKSLMLARESYRAIDGLKLEDLNAAAGYAEASAWLMEALVVADRVDEARRVGEESLKVAAQILDRRPGHMAALRSHALIAGNLTSLEFADLRVRKALELATLSAEDYEAFLKLDPGNTNSRGNLMGSRSAIAGGLESLGQSSAAIEMYRKSLRTFDDGVGRLGSGPIAGALAGLEAEMGARAAPDLPKLGAYVDAVKKLPEGAFLRLWIPRRMALGEAELAIIRGEYGPALAGGRAAMRDLEAIKSRSESDKRQLQGSLATAHRVIGWASYNLADYATAEAEMRKSIALLEKLPAPTTGDKVFLSDHRVLLALAIARQGRLDEARKVNDPELKFQRELVARGSEDLGQHVMYARSLLAAALSSPAARQENLAEAAKVIDRMPAEMKQRKTVALLRGWIAEQMKRS